MSTDAAEPSAQVQHFRQVLLWPLSVSTRGAATGHPPWHALRDQGQGSPWREQVDEYTGDTAKFHERHYQEFVTFLPYVQHFLFGEGRATREAAGEGSDAEAPMRVFRRRDVAAVHACPDHFRREIGLEPQHAFRVAEPAEVLARAQRLERGQPIYSDGPLPERGWD